jgi:hypothetical protein
MATVEFAEPIQSNKPCFSDDFALGACLKIPMDAVSSKELHGETRRGRIRFVGLRPRINEVPQVSRSSHK